jgi:RNA polymerase sigma-70 factor (ECF subfamily)
LSLPSARSGFESAVLENLDAAHNLARWLMRNDEDAQDAVQEACMKALRAYSSLRGADFRPWFLAIVRNTCFTWLHRKTGSRELAAELSLDVGPEVAADAACDPQAIAIRAADAQAVRRAIDQLSVVLREAIVLREMQGLSYKEIGKIAGVPIGTVMSRLARGRSQLQHLLMATDRPEPSKLAREGAT